MLQKNILISVVEPSWAKLIKRLHPAGFGFVTGTNPDTGVGGLTLAGGWGFLSKQHGFAVDNLIEVEAVLATGEIVIARDNNAHSDLLRALRGGGNFLAIITRFRFLIHDVNDCIFGILPRFAPTRKSQFLTIKNYLEWLKTTPNYVTGGLGIPCGAPIIVNFGIAIGPELKNATGYQDVPALNDLVNLPGPWFTLQNTIAKGSYHSKVQTMFEAFTKRGYFINSGYMLTNFPDELIHELLNLTKNDYVSSQHTIAIIGLGGKTKTGVEGRPTCVRHRKANYWVVAECNAKQAEIPATIEWITKVKEALIRFDATPVSLEDEESRKFLEVVKNKYDPNNFFPKNLRGLFEPRSFDPKTF